eukprot:jgi/Tetstr1/422221/TSEL_013073.t1
MMAELRQLSCLLDSHGIHLRARYIPSAANIWADRLSRHLDSGDWQLHPLLFVEPESRFGPHSIYRFASALNTLLPRYNAAWLDPACEAVDSLHPPDADWRRRENNWTFFKDHGREPMALGDLVSMVRKGLAASQGTDPSTVVRVELFRASLAVVLCLFFCRGGAGVECRTGDLTVGPDGGILLYHRDRKGKRGADASKKLLYQLPASAHADIAELLHYFEAARQVFAGGRVLAAR